MEKPSGGGASELDRTSRPASPVYSLKSSKPLAGPVRLRFQLGQPLSSHDAARLIAATRRTASGRWALLPGRLSGKTFTVETRHFSDYQLRIAKDPPATKAEPWTSSTSLVALGDSFSSGEGVPPFAPETDTRKDTCHRSYQAWPLIVGRQINAATTSFACSGAKIKHVLRKQKSHEPPQLRRLKESPAPSVVTLTIGGNDIGFVPILADCVVTSHCDQHLRATRVIDLQISFLSRRLPDLYHQIAEAAPNAQVVVLGYPRLFPRSPALVNCAALNGVDVLEQRYLNAETDKADDAIADAARQAGVRYVDVRSAFDGHELSCSPDRYVNPISFGGRRIVSPFSFHPNEAGQTRLAELAVAALLPGTRVSEGASCGAYRTGRIPAYGPPGGDRRSRDVVVRVVSGSVPCIEARGALDWYVHAHNPCVNAGNTCVLDREGWTCYAPSAGSYPVIFECDRDHERTRVVAWAAEAAQIKSRLNDCGDASPDPPGPYRVRANFQCVAALQVARRAGDEAPRSGRKMIEGFSCSAKPDRAGGSSVSCAWDGRIVQFDYGGAPAAGVPAAARSCPNTLVPTAGGGGGEIRSVRGMTCSEAATVLRSLLENQDSRGFTCQGGAGVLGKCVKGSRSFVFASD